MLKMGRNTLIYFFCSQVQRNTHCHGGQIKDLRLLISLCMSLCPALHLLLAAAETTHCSSTELHRLALGRGDPSWGVVTQLAAHEDVLSSESSWWALQDHLVLWQWYRHQTSLLCTLLLPSAPFNKETGITVLTSISISLFPIALLICDTKVQFPQVVT